MPTSKQSGGGSKFKRNRTKCENYRARGIREKHKEIRVIRDGLRAKLMKCGHGSRHKHPVDGQCRRCFRVAR